MKLLIYSHFFAPSIGGVETIVLSLAEGLAKLRDAHGGSEFAVTMVTQTPAGNFNDGALPFRVIRRPGLVHVWQLIRASDLVHAAGPAIAPLLLSRLARKPLVVEHHGYQATCPNGLLLHHPTKSVCPGHFQARNYVECFNCNSKMEGPWRSLRLVLSTFLRRACSRRAARNIAPSNHVASRQSLPRTATVFHGVDDSFPKGAAGTESQAVGAESFAYLGRLVVEKGVSVLLEAARLLREEGREFNILLIGDGPDRPRLQRQIAAGHLESCVRITGFLSGGALERTLRTARTVVLPSIWEETAGLAALEQMALGRVVIASAIGGLREIVEGAGLTFSPGDPYSLASAMKRILAEPGLASSLGALARDRVLRSFSLSGMIDAHRRLYFQELNGCRPAPHD